MGEGRQEPAVSLDVSAVPLEPAGAGRYTIELARALASRGELALTLVCRRDDAGRWATVAPGARLVPRVWTSRPARLAYESLAMGRAVGSLDHPRIGVHHGPHYTMPKAMAGVARVVTVHDLTFFDHPQWHQSSKVAFFRRAIARACSDADALICVSDEAARRLGELMRPRPPVFVIPHGIDGSRFRPATDGAADSRLVEAAGIHASAEFVLHLGTIEPRKGLVELVAAFGPVASKRPDLLLVLAGHRGWGAAELRDEVSARRLTSQVRELGYVPEEAVPALMRRARVVVYPSHEEGFGLPALEALACGALLVTTAGTAMAGFAKEAAFLARPGVVSDLTALMEEALSLGHDERERRRALGLGVAGEHTWDKAATAHVGAYMAACERAR
ncbi:MAG: glycosyltransferase family 4 protein [Acidimicrobiales bacterium]